MLDLIHMKKVDGYSALMSYLDFVQIVKKLDEDYNVNGNSQ